MKPEKYYDGNTIKAVIDLIFGTNEQCMYSEAWFLHIIQLPSMGNSNEKTNLFPTTVVPDGKWTAFDYPKVNFICRDLMGFRSSLSADIMSSTKKRRVYYIDLKSNQLYRMFDKDIHHCSLTTHDTVHMRLQSWLCITQAFSMGSPFVSSSIISL